MAYPATIPVRLFKQGEFAVINGKKYVPERTCRNLGKDFTCSECGANVCGGSFRHSYCDSDGTRWYTTKEPPNWNYCPNCGAKVVGA